MKITIYELLGLIKDGKEPKKIKYRQNIFEFIHGLDDYKPDDIKKYHGNYLFHYLFEEEVNFLNDEVEIIKEDKKIEKLPYYSLEKIQKSKNKDEYYENRLKLLEKRINDYHNKINELIDEINNLKEND